MIIENYSETQFFALLGKPVKKAMSPAIQSANIKSLGMNAVFTAFEVEEEDIPKIISVMPAMRFKGLTVTMPYKQKVIPYVEELDEMGALCGAVNTIYWKNGKLTGTITDGTGLVLGLKNQINCDVAGKACSIFGSGGASRGISFALLKAGAASVSLWDIPKSRDMAEKLASELNAYKNGACKIVSTDEGDIKKIVGGAEIVINATPAGMTPNEDAMICDTKLLRPDQIVCDAVYLPPMTKFLKNAEAEGCKIMQGYWMLLWQGAESFRLWTGYEADMDAMKKALFERLLPKEV